MGTADVTKHCGRSGGPRPAQGTNGMAGPAGQPGLSNGTSSYGSRGPSGYSSLRVPELRGLCEQRGLPVDGFKQVLVQRLEAQDTEASRAAATQPSQTQTEVSMPSSIKCTKKPPWRVASEEATAVAKELAGEAHSKARAQVVPSPPPPAQPLIPVPPTVVAVPPPCPRPVAPPVQLGLLADGTCGVSQPQLQNAGTPCVGPTLVVEMPAVREEKPVPAGMGMQAKHPPVEQLLAAPARPTAVKSMSVTAPAKAVSVVAKTSSPDSLPSQAPAVQNPPSLSTPAPTALDLTDDERTLRGLLQFFVCSDVQRRVNPLSIKYRDFVSAAHDVITAPKVAPNAVVAAPVPASKAPVAAVQQQTVPSTVAASVRTLPVMPPAAPPAPPAPQALHPLPPGAAAKAAPLAPQGSPPAVPSAAAPPGTVIEEPKPASSVSSQAKAPAKRPAEPQQAPAREEALRRKAEEIMDSHLKVSHLMARREALTAQLHSMQEAVALKAAERRKLQEKLTSLSAEQEQRRERLRTKVLHRADASWAAQQAAAGGAATFAPAGVGPAASPMSVVEAVS